MLKLYDASNIWCLVNEEETTTEVESTTEEV